MSDAVARDLIRGWCKMQREKYGPEWKALLAAEMAADTAPVLAALLRLQSTPEVPRTPENRPHGPHAAHEKPA